MKVPHDKISTGPSPLEGPYAPNTLLRQSQRLLEGEVDGSETVVVDEAGDLLVLDKFGYMKQATRDGKGNYYVKGNATYLGAGRPLGGHIAPSGDFLICDSTKVDELSSLLPSCVVC